MDGEVIDIVPNETMTVKYKDDHVETLDILPRKSKTKRGAFISLEMSSLEKGTKFKKNQLLAFTKNFESQNNMYCSGKNVTVAIMNYFGYSHESSWQLN